MFGLGTREIVLLVVVIVLLFGASRIPALTKSIVDSIRHLRGAFSDDEDKDTGKAASDSKKRS